MAFDRVSVLFVSFLLVGVSSAVDHSQGLDGIFRLGSLSFLKHSGRQIPVEKGVKACCLPKVFTGTLITEVRPATRPSNSTETVYVDQNSRRIASDIVVPGLYNASQITLFDSGSNATTYIFDKATKKCTKRVYSEAKFPPMCLPDDMKLVASFSLGAGAETLNAQMWSYQRNAGVRSNLILTPTNCIPILNEINIRQQTRTSGIRVLYINFKTTISDPSVFVPPSYCPKISEPEAIDGEDDIFKTIVDRYVALF